MSVNIRKNITVYPHFGFNANMFLGGGRCKEGVVRELLLCRNHCQREFPAPKIPALKHDKREVIYGGSVGPHYGHFLLEGLSRVWYIKKHPELPVVWSGQRRFNKWQTEILGLLGIKNEHVFVRIPARFKEMHIPSPGFICRNYFSEEQSQALRVEVKKKEGFSEFVYLSRGRFEIRGQARSLLKNEAELEKLLIRNGWAIIYPEEHTVRSQIEIFSSAKVVLGGEGSEMHTLIFTPALDTRVIVLGRDRFQNANYATIADRNRLDYNRLEGVVNNGEVDLDMFSKMLVESDNFQDMTGVRTGHGDFWDQNAMELSDVYANLKTSIGVKASIYYVLRLIYSGFQQLNFLGDK